MGSKKTLIINCIVVIFFKIYFLYNTQRMMDGKFGKDKFNEDDYILAVISLYTNLFIILDFILELHGNI